MKRDKTAFALALSASIKKARGERSYQDVSNATNGAISARMIANYEDGTEPRYSTLLVLAAALGCKVSELVGVEVIRASEKKDTAKLVSLVECSA